MFKTEEMKLWSGNETVVTKEYLAKIKLPEESEGICINNKGISRFCISVQNRQNYMPDKIIPLANGYCIGCWDTGKGGQMPKNSYEGQKENG